PLPFRPRLLSVPDADAGRGSRHPVGPFSWLLLAHCYQANPRSLGARWLATAFLQPACRRRTAALGTCATARSPTPTQARRPPQPTGAAPTTQVDPLL